MPHALSLAAVTDEFSADLDVALDAMAACGMTGAELRGVWGRNIIELSDEDVDRAREAVERRHMRVLSIASPILKCTLPDAPPVDARLQQDMFSARYTFEDQPALTARAIAIARRAGARIIRVFSYWRTIDPDACLPRVADALRALADQASAAGLLIGLENEHACNIATGHESARLLAAVDHPGLGLIWDPANAMVLGERAFPDGYDALPKTRVVHVHAKDVRVTHFLPAWLRIGDGDVNWRGQIDALRRDGYAGAISLETHWTGPHGDKLEASRTCGEVLRTLCSM
jgi:sugar phosphate isomerase/epimerase